MEDQVMLYELVILPPLSAEVRHWAQRLAEDVPETRVVIADDESAAIDALRTGAAAAVGTMTPNLLSHAPQLRWLQAPVAAPPEGYFFAELAAHPVVVTNLRGVYTDHVATHALALLLSLSRNLHRYARLQADCTWQQITEIDSILHFPQATVLILGLGGVGVEIGKMLQPLGCRVIATDARLSDPPRGMARVGSPEQLDDLLPLADAVVVTVPYTPQTHRLIDERRLALMKPSALLINIGRGKVVDVDAVALALSSGHLRGAAFDVFPNEPLDPDHPLWVDPRAIVTPHVAAVGPFKEDRRYSIVRDNAQRFASGESLLNVVNKEQWY